MLNRPEAVLDNENLTESDFELVNRSETIHDAVFTNKPVGFFMDVIMRLRRNRATMTALALIIIISFMAIVGPSMNSYGYNQQNVNYVNLPPKIPALEKLGIADGTRVLLNKRGDYLEDKTKYPDGSVLEIIKTYEVNGVPMVDIRVDAYKLAGAPDDTYFVMGTDYLGRDQWTRLWRGARISLTIAVLSVAVNICIGVIYGSIAGYYGGKADMLMMRFTEILGAFPQTIIATMLMLLLGRGISAIVIALMIRGWVGTAKLIRAQFFRFKGREYVLAARTLGVGDRKLIFRHILPNSVGPIITKAMVEIPSAIFAEAFLAFIGLGLQAPEPSIGVMLSDAQKTLMTYPYQMVFPAILISVLMISFNLFGNGLRDAIDPTMRGVD
ncbi:MAG: ABC transporter permease [Clostridiaceae bacterium]|nr:ABC transporter permease [Clostridiaceae bacterium]